MQLIFLFVFKLTTWPEHDDQDACEGYRTSNPVPNIGLEPVQKKSPSEAKQNKESSIDGIEAPKIIHGLQARHESIADQGHYPAETEPPVTLESDCLPH